MRTLKAELITVAPVARAFPPVDLPEVAVVGRSNAGKSTLINTLVGQRRLARVSGQPGKTRAIVFFDVESRFVLADLPGYGYARGPRQDQAAWRDLVASYFGSGRPIAAVMALFDVRRKPDDLDRALIDMLEANGLAWLPIWTKADKLKANALRKARHELDRALGRGQTGLAFSSKSRLGRDDLFAWLERRLAERA